MSSKFYVDSSSVDRMLNSLNKKDRLKAERSALRSSAGILKRKTDSMYVQRTKLKRNSVTFYSGFGSSRTKVTKRSRIASVVVYKREAFAKVHILNNFLVKWFELSTRSRRTKGNRVTGYNYTKRTGRSWYKNRVGKGRYTGMMLKGRGLFLFDKAQSATKSRVFGEMKDKLYKSIMRIARKNGRS